MGILSILLVKIKQIGDQACESPTQRKLGKPLREAEASLFHKCKKNLGYF